MAFCSVVGKRVEALEECPNGTFEHMEGCDPSCELHELQKKGPSSTGEAPQCSKCKKPKPQDNFKMCKACRKYYRDYEQKRIKGNSPPSNNPEKLPAPGEGEIQRPLDRRKAPEKDYDTRRREAGARMIDAILDFWDILNKTEASIER